jgi:hypothetical protein
MQPRSSAATGTSPSKPTYGKRNWNGEMQPGLTRVTAIFLAAMLTGCSSVSDMFSHELTPAQSPAEEAQEDQKCQSSGYQINTPAYEYCRGELARQRTVADRSQPAPPLSAHR